MTGKIKSAIGALELAKNTRFFMPNNNELKIAIRSLEAWEEVLNELEEKADFADCCGDMEEKLGIKSAINIINQKLTEIEKER